MQSQVASFDAEDENLSTERDETIKALGVTRNSEKGVRRSRQETHGAVMATQISNTSTLQRTDIHERIDQQVRARLDTKWAEFLAAQDFDGQFQVRIDTSVAAALAPQDLDGQIEATIDSKVREALAAPDFKEGLQIAVDAKVAEVLAARGHGGHLQAAVQTRIAKTGSTNNTGHRTGRETHGRMSERSRSPHQEARPSARRRSPETAESPRRLNWSPRPRTGRGAVVVAIPGRAVASSIANTPSPVNSDPEPLIDPADLRRPGFIYGNLPAALFDRLRKQITETWDPYRPDWTEGRKNGVPKCADRWAHRNGSDMRSGYACADCVKHRLVCVAVIKGEVRIYSLSLEPRGQAAKSEMNYWVRP